MPNYYGFTFVQPHGVSRRYPDAVRDMADVLSDGVVIQNVKDMVARVLFQLAQSGGQISNMKFAGHGGKGYFHIGWDHISHLTIMKHARDLVRLAPHFSPNAIVTLYSCETAFNATVMYMLSVLWPGVTVNGWTKGVNAYTDPVFGDGIEGRGKQIVCSMSGCYKAGFK